MTFKGVGWGAVRLERPLRVTWEFSDDGLFQEGEESGKGDDGRGGKESAEEDEWEAVAVNG